MGKKVYYKIIITALHNHPLVNHAKYCKLMVLSSHSLTREQLQLNSYVIFSLFNEETTLVK